MSTGTAHRSDAVYDDIDRATTRVVVVAIIATLAVAWSLVLVYAYTSQSGLHLDPAQAILAALAVALVPGLLAAWAVHLEGRAWEGVTTRFAVLAVVCVLLMTCGVAVVATFGAQAYDDQHSRTTATSVTVLGPG